MDVDRKCDSKDVALKTFFLGPMAENGNFFISWVNDVLDHWMTWRRKLFPEDGEAITAFDQNDPEFLKRKINFHQKMNVLIERYESEIPTHSPRYMGHMFSEVSLPALMGHWIALLHNPNNVASEASRVGIQIEKEGIASLLTMVGWDPQDSIGHFTSGGSVANFEALFRAREWFTKKFPAKSGKVRGVILVPRNRHYSWIKACKLMAIPDEDLIQIDLDEKGRMSSFDLIKKIRQVALEQKKIMMVVSVMGSTEFGSFDPIHEVNWALDKFSLSERPWHHVDAAYGGFFCSVKPRGDGLTLAQSSDAHLQNLFTIIEALDAVESITLDPHKLAYVPYACGAFLCREKEGYYITHTSAPYLENHSALDRGLFTLEGSRSATGPTATWLTSETLGFNSEGLGRILNLTLNSRKEFEKAIQEKIQNAYVIDAGVSNILALVIAKPNESLKITNQRTKNIYELYSPLSEGKFIFSKTILMKNDYNALIDHTVSKWSGVQDTDQLYVLRFCLMNPFVMSKEMKRQFFADVCKDITENLLKLDLHHV